MCLKQAEKEGGRTTVGGAMVTHPVKCVQDAQCTQVLGDPVKDGK